MTLNIILASRTAAYLGADFRLTAMNGRKYLDNYNTQKILPVVRRDWSALVAYAGLASAPPVISDMGQWILEQIDNIHYRSNYTELDQRLSGIEKLLHRIRGNPAIAISIVGFENHRPFVRLISNYATPNGTTNTTMDMVTYKFRGTDAWIGLQGDIPAVISEEKELLQSLLKKKNAESSTVRTEIATVIANAFNRSRSISRECVTGYLNPSGYFEIGPHGMGGDKEYFPEFVKSDLFRHGVCGFNVKLDAQGNRMPIQWQGMTATKGKTTQGKVTIFIHVLRNIASPIPSTPKPPDTTVVWKIAGENEPKKIKFQIHGPSIETSPSIAEYHSQLITHCSSGINEVLMQDLKSGEKLGDLIVIIAEPSDTNAKRIISIAEPSAPLDVKHLILTAKRASAIHLFDFAPEASSLLARHAPTGAVRIACVTNGTTSVGTGFFSTKKKRFKKRGNWECHTLNQIGSKNSAAN